MAFNIGHTGQDDA